MTQTTSNSILGVIRQES